jgi:UDP:flavonoid glycosyltransferase YjiC (YdhE family)
MRLVVTTLGSSGDLFPYLPIARALVHRGHVVRFAANPVFRRVVEGEGFEFVPVGVALGADQYATHPEILSPRRGGFIGLRSLFRHFLLPHLPRVFDEMRSAARGCDALLTHPAQLAAPMVAERLSIPWLTLSMFPGNIPSRYTVPPGSMHRALTGRLGESLNLFAWHAARWIMRREFDGPLNVVRANLGLTQKRDVFLLGGLSPRGVLLLCSQAYAGRPSDWPNHIVCTGFTPFDTPDGAAVPDALRQFLESGDPPVLVSLGESAAYAPEDFFDQARRALEGIRRRGVFLVGRDANMACLPADSSGRWTAFPFAPFSEVLPSCAAFVHAGGFGATEAALHAGVPQVIVPRAFDQPWHAARVRALGLGASIPWARRSVARLREALQHVLRDAALADRARTMSDKLAREDGTRRTAERIEQIIGHGGPAATAGGLLRGQDFVKSN